jgi:prevent-host-death family protein
MAIYGYALAMKTVSVATLKNELSHYLRKVADGEEVVVTSHDQPVARIVPFKRKSSLVIIPPRRPAFELKKIKGVKPLKEFDVVEMLMEDRRKR